MKIDYNVDNLKTFVDIDVDYDIKKYEYMYIKNHQIYYLSYK